MLRWDGGWYPRVILGDKVRHDGAQAALRAKVRCGSNRKGRIAAIASRCQAGKTLALASYSGRAPNQGTTEWMETASSRNAILSGVQTGKFWVIPSPDRAG